MDLAPGNYALLCFFPDPAKDGTPHVLEGMLKEITISLRSFDSASIARDVAHPRAFGSVPGLPSVRSGVQALEGSG